MKDRHLFSNLGLPGRCDNTGDLPGCPAKFYISAGLPNYSLEQYNLGIPVNPFGFSYINTMPSIQESKLAFIGGGNMASAIIGGLLSKGVNKQNICVSEPWDVNREKMAALGVRTTTSNVEAGGDADLVIIAVKPQVTKGVCQELGGAWSPRATLPVVVSIAAGITLDSLKEWLTTSDSRTAHTVRVMPNTPALVGEGASGAFATADITSDEKELVNAMLGSVSKATEWVDREELLDVVTGLSGKSPAS